MGAYAPPRALGPWAVGRAPVPRTAPCLCLQGARARAHGAGQLQAAGKQHVLPTAWLCWFLPRRRGCVLRQSDGG